MSVYVYGLQFYELEATRLDIYARWRFIVVGNEGREQIHRVSSLELLSCHIPHGPRPLSTTSSRSRSYHLLLLPLPAEVQPRLRYPMPAADCCLAGIVLPMNTHTSLSGLSPSLPLHRFRRHSTSIWRVDILSRKEGL